MVYQRTITIDMPHEDAVVRTREALAAHGFGVLTEIDMKATLKAKRGVDIEPYVILGACNPELAQGALAVDPAVGVLLPCSVVVRSEGSGRSVVHVFEPALMPEVTGLTGLQVHADDASHRLAAVLVDLQG